MVTLMDLHINYRLVAPFKFLRVDVPEERAQKAGLRPKPILRSDPRAAQIKLDSETMLSNVPPAAWNYKLGNHSALEWVLDQYKEKAPKDPTVRGRFNDYRFANHKGSVIDLLARVTTVSVETIRIIAEMRITDRAHK